MMWGKKKINGTVYDLTHLDPFNMPIGLPGGRETTLQVQFGCHVFTENFTPLHDRALAFSDGRDLRAFCLKRYGYCLSLPSAVKQAVDERVYLDNQGRTHISGELPGLEGCYLIGFKLRERQTKKFDAVMQIKTAHHRKVVEALPSAPFRVYVSAFLKGRKVDWKKK